MAEFEKLAIHISSPSLYNRLYINPPDSQEERYRVSLKRLRYIIRMSTRPTPFGLHAGISFAKWGERTNLELEASHISPVARPAYDLIRSILEKSIRNNEFLLYVPIRRNPALRYRGKAVILDDGVDRAELMLTPKIIAILEMTASAVLLKDLLATDARNIDGLHSRALKLVQQLLNSRILLPMIDAPIGQDMADYAISLLTDMGDWASLQKLRAAVDSCARFKTSRGIERHHCIAALNQLATENSLESRSPLHVDACVGLANDELGQTVRAEIARAAELLVLTSPTSNSELEQFRHHFIDHYGANKEVLLLTVLDPCDGIGPYPAEANGSQENADLHLRRNQCLLRIAESALLNRALSVDLTPDILEKICFPVGQFPSSFEVAFQLAARHRCDIDKGKFNVVISPNFGSPAAGRYIGRFTYLMNTGEKEKVRKLVAYEESVARAHLKRNCVFAELVFSPNRRRMTNVITRQLFRQYELLVSGTPTNESQVIHPSDLVLGVHDGRFYLRSLSRNVYVEVRSGHMLRTIGEGSLVRFLHAVSEDGFRRVSRFDWGTAECLRVLPRVTCGRIILRPSEWKLQAAEICSETCLTDMDLSNVLTNWRRMVRAPRELALTFADNVLELDLDNRDHRRILQEEADSLGGKEDLILREVLPRPCDSWLKQGGAAFRSEFVVSVVQEKAAVDLGFQEYNTNGPVQPKYYAPSSTRYSVGSEWLFLTLYCALDLQTRILTEELFPFFNRLMPVTEANRWFFVRYRDPRHHIRVRLRGEPAWLLKTALPKIVRWARIQVDRELCEDFSFVTYDREVERYGGDQPLKAIERFFCMDSNVVCCLLKAQALGEFGDFRLAEIAALGMDAIMTAMVPSPEKRIEKLTERLGIAPGQHIADMRDRMKTWVSLFEINGSSYSQHGKSTRLRNMLFSAAIEMKRRVEKLYDKGVSTHSPQALVNDLCHMHCNRVLGTTPKDEFTAAAILWRIYNRSLHMESKANLHPS